MFVSKKFIIIIAAGLFILLPVFDENLSGIFFITYNAVCFGFLFLDFFRSPKKSVFVITRPPEDKLYFKAVNTVFLHVRNNYQEPIEVTLKDEVPDLHFKVNQENMTKTVSPYELKEFSYSIIPTKRGSFLFPNIYIKYKSLWGLCYKYASVPLPVEFKVYPNVKDISKYRLLMVKSMKLENGKRIVNLKGAGQEFESLREYVEGDEYKKINWMATARGGKLIVNQYEAKKNQPVIILIDTGRSMSYHIREASGFESLIGYKKLDYAINAALILSDIVNQKGDNSGLMIFNTEVDAYLKPGKGPLHRNSLMEALYHIKDTLHTSDYSLAFRTLITRQKRRSIVFIFTDFETDVEAGDLVSQIKLLRRRHIPVVVLMKNESVIRLLNQTDKNAKAQYQKAAAEEYLLERQRLKRLLNLSGVACIESSAENFAIDAVNHYLKTRALKQI